VPGGTVISKARAWQLVVKKTIASTDFRVTLGRVSTAQQLARINNDTGLQEDQGPGLVKTLTISARHYFRHGSLQALFAKADARVRDTGEPTPEAPRLLWDLLGTLDKLPFQLHARAEVEYMGRKPLGEGFVGPPIKQFRGAAFRSFESRRMDIGVNFLIADGYTGQTLEALALAGEEQPLQRITGFPLRSYVSLSWSYRFGR
jgi:hypothetical protein